jgi:pSer/pThr/pTyr-binding forkhead associated (FHA) protein
LVCPHCGLVLDSGGRTRQINVADIRLEQKKQMPGEVFVQAEKPITCLFDDRSLQVNVGKSVVFGRCSGIAGDAEPDVDLSPFEAAEKGVSRQHIKIQFKSPLFYVTDLGSSNGTWLNGRRLVPNSGRPLRHGDELRLGQLKMSVRF